MKEWQLALLQASREMFAQEGKTDYVDLIDSTPFGAIDIIFQGCKCVHQVETRCEHILEILSEPEQDTDSDWV